MEKRLGISLLLLRIGIFIVMLMWTIDKIVNPDHAIAVFKAFYFFPQVGHTVSFVIGAVEVFYHLPVCHRRVEEVYLWRCHDPARHLDHRVHEAILRTVGKPASLVLRRLAHARRLHCAVPAEKGR